ncbi:hypothetical protein EA58_14455 [Photobacterium galatheae]|uniref:Uncharacterized protein n=1 Tax=Photobacterium galatheae TaxID=1654360 RepID=A0A066RU86_9GAMM|nr:hypothetical protein EA58_14455 [Photobacterium galatheae]
MYYRRAVGLSNGALIHLKFDRLHHLSRYRGGRDVEGKPKVKTVVMTMLKAVRQRPPPEYFWYE